MKRREMLKLGAALAVVPSVPAAPPPLVIPFLEVEMLRDAFDTEIWLRMLDDAWARSASAGSMLNTGMWEDV